MFKNIWYLLSFVKKYCVAYLVLTVLFSMTAIFSPLVDTLFPKLIVDGLVQGGAPTYVWVLLLGVFVIQIVNMWAYSYFLTYYVPKAEHQVKKGIKQSLYERVAALDLAFFETTEMYESYTLAFKEVDQRVSTLMRCVSGLLNSIFYLSTLFVIIVALDPILLILAFASTAISFMCGRLMSKKRYEYEMKANMYRRREQYVDRVYYEPRYAKDVRLFSLSRLLNPFYESSATNLQQTINKETFKLATLEFIMNGLKGPILQVLIMGYLILNIVDGRSSIGDFTALLLATVQMGNQLYGLTFQYNQLHEQSLFIENLKRVMSLEPKLETRKGMAVKQDKLAIELNNVSFTYPNQNQQILSHLNLAINQGEKIGIVGHNGAGKSTLIKLLAQLYEPTEGELLIGGKSASLYDMTSWRQSLGLVMQDLNYYPHSIAQNLMLRHEIMKADEVLIQNALERVGLLNFVLSLPKGIHTALTTEFEEDGVMLSGGQLQKLAIARLYVHDYPVLLLDEPSSALDPKAEYELATMLLESMQEKTVVMVSHRLSLTKNLDRIIVVDQGEIIECGTHQELMNQNGYYAELFNLQKEQYENTE